MKRLGMSILAASMLAAFAGGAQAQSAAQSNEPARTAAARSGSVDFLSGGVSLEARQELAAQAKQYNLHLEFAYAPEGEYLSEVQVDIADSRGNNVLSTRTQGPWLLAKLPAGNYTVTAKFGDTVRKQQVNVGAGKRHLVMRFPAKVETMTTEGGPHPMVGGAPGSMQVVEVGQR